MQYYTVIKIMFLKIFTEELLMTQRNTHSITFVENAEYRISLKMMPLILKKEI